MLTPLLAAGLGVVCAFAACGEDDEPADEGAGGETPAKTEAKTEAKGETAPADSDDPKGPKPGSRSGGGGAGAPAGGGASDGSRRSPGPAGARGRGRGDGPVKQATVIIKDREFSPRRVTVARGGSIYWVNKDAKSNHTATKTRGPGQAPASPNIGLGGDTYTDFFRTRGRIEYICTYHREMKGYITVK